MSKLSLAVHTATTHHRRLRLIVTAATAIALAVAAAPASADTLVYVKNGAVYVAQPDGTQARAVTAANNGWAWPSETDSGIIAVAGGLSRINGSFNPSGGDEIYEFDQQGTQVAGPVATQGTYSTVNDPEYVTHFRVAPDNSNVAWTDISSNADPFTAWRNPNGSGTFSTANDCCAPLSYSNPEWWGSTHLLITHDGATLGSQPNFTFYNLSDGSNVGWNQDQAVGSAPSYQVTVSRNGLVYAVETDDGPDGGGTIHNVAITLETANTPPDRFDGSTQITAGCKITLPASQVATNHGSSLASMSFSSDGSTLAWGQDDGIYEANVSHPTDCATVTSSVHLVVPGGEMPFLGAAALSPAVAPTPNPTPKPTPCSCTPPPRLAGAPNTAITGLRLSKHSRKATLKFRGWGGAGALSFKCKLDRGRWTSCRSAKVYRHLKKGRHTFEVKAVDARGKADSTPATRRFTI
ncbi:MAG: hypothetical protein ACTHMY_18700 [Solirubrobacteraceae bacterium]